MDPNATPPANQPQVFNANQIPPQQIPPQQNTQPQPSGGGSSGGNKKKLIIGGVVAGVVLLLILAVILVVASSSNSPVVQEAESEPQNPQPATTIGIEQINNSISQDLSAIDDARDFPESQLTDDTLGL